MLSTPKRADLCLVAKHQYAYLRGQCLTSETPTSPESPQKEIFLQTSLVCTPDLMASTLRSARCASRCTRCTTCWPSSPTAASATSPSPSRRPALASLARMRSTLQKTTPKLLDYDLVFTRCERPCTEYKLKQEQKVLHYNGLGLKNI